MLACLIIIGHLLLNAIMTGFLLQVSYHNYPGGKALQDLNSHVNAADNSKFWLTCPPSTYFYPHRCSM